MKRRVALFIVVLVSALSAFVIESTVAGQKPKRRDRDDRREGREEREERERAQPKGEARGRDVDDPAEEEQLNRELWEFARHTDYQEILPYVAAAQLKSRANQVSEVELPNGWRIAPAGTQVDVGKLPYEAVLFAGKLVVLDTGYYYTENDTDHDKDPQEVSIVDTTSGRVEKTLKIKSLFPSAIVGADGDLYISGGFDQKVIRVDRQFNVVREYAVGGFAGGLASIDAQHLVVGYLAIKDFKDIYTNGRIAILNTKTGTLQKEVDLGYFPYAVRYIAGKLFVTLLGENKLLIYNAQLKLIKTISVGRTPQEMCADDRRLYVVNTGSDSLSVINARTNSLTSTISVAATGSRFGTTPTSCAVDADRLYVTLAGTNAVAVLDRATNKQLELVPTGWYPTKVLLNQDQLLVLNAKGIRPRHPNPNGPQADSASRVPEYVLNLIKGTVSIVPRSDVQKHAAIWTTQVDSASPIFDPQQGLKLPIKHVFYIIKENRTYDQVLGDLGRGNGDPRLTLFDESIAPVHHQLAREFVTLDNFFVNGEISVLGHAFTTSGYASPFAEWLGNLSYSYRWKGYPFGSVPATMSPVYLWDILDDKRIDYRIYGENYFLFTRAYRIFNEMYGPESRLARRFYDQTIAAAGGGDRGHEFNELALPYYGRADSRPDAYKLLGDATFTKALSQFLTGDQSFAQAVARNDSLRRRFAAYLYRYPFNYRSWDLKYSDLDRARAWKQDFETQLKRGEVAQLSYIWLPNDHTDGNSRAILDPFQFFAQNDAALGRIVETISHSSIWKDSLILVVEDDAQNGPDHVDATRSIALVAGPYVKRGAVISDRYDQLSMLRTIELVLGLRSLNSAEQLAAPMFGIFTDKPNYAPFVAAAPSGRLAAADRARYEQLSH